MPNYMPPVDDVNFLLREVLGFDGLMAELPQYAEIDAELAASVLEESGRFCAEILEPINQQGDEVGAKFENGVVTTAPGFSAAYADYVRAGWPGLSGASEFGGQGLPRVMQILCDEMVSSTNLAFGLFPGLTRGAVEAIGHHGSEALKATYLSKMISGEWTGVMALTESNAGTDLGLMTTRAVPEGDGSFKLTGTKIFISSGDHDFGGNIIHLVLARLPDAPEGVKGISLFLVPKFLVDEAGNLGARNGVHVGALEHKMGIHAQPTCVMNYDDAIGWMVGQPNRGLNAMFTMMNAERLFVGVQGLGVGEAAYQKARTYAQERLQGRSLDGTRGPVAIIEHPDVRKMLLTARSLTEGGRALAAWTALQMDVSIAHPDAEKRAEAEGFVALLTPVIKAALTDFGFESAVLAQQVFGGHGYIREWGMEQFVRDARITQIYEGTNGVQAMDLVGRKLGFENGGLPQRFFALVRDEIAGAGKAGDLAEVTGPVLDALERLEAATHQLQEGGDMAESGGAATDYLRLFALVAFGWMWVRMAGAAQAKGEDATPLHAGKIQVARFFVDRVLPQTMGLEAAIANGAASMMALDAEAF